MKPGKPFSEEKHPRKLKPSGLPMPPADVLVAAPEVSVPVTSVPVVAVPVSMAPVVVLEKRPVVNWAAAKLPMARARSSV